MYLVTELKQINWKYKSLSSRIMYLSNYKEFSLANNLNVLTAIS